MSEVSREVANITERKNSHTPVIKNCNSTHFYEIVDLQKTSYISKNFATLAAKPVFCLLKKWWNGFIKQCFKAEVKFLTQKSPLLNLLSCHSSMVSMACFLGGPRLKSQQGRELLILNKKESIIQIWIVTWYYIWYVHVPKRHRNRQRGMSTYSKL